MPNLLKLLLNEDNEFCSELLLLNNQLLIEHCINKVN